MADTAKLDARTISASALKLIFSCPPSVGSSQPPPITANTWLACIAVLIKWRTAALPWFSSYETLALSWGGGGTQVNWGRGLFRLWVIFSALWIAVLSAIFIKDGHLLEANKTYDIEGRLKEKYEVVTPPNTSPAEVVGFTEQNKRLLRE